MEGESTPEETGNERIDGTRELCKVLEKGRKDNRSEWEKER